MGQCNLDHSQEDVYKKYESQIEFLPLEIRDLFEKFFKNEHKQEILNEVFHLLKKYDLSSVEERENRNKQLNLLLKNL
ncbi:hypothetical protein [Neobacillus sp. LXY-4]|uniref:hypothetical protein n=1 Tax=Neobacillus sp. LXY-4 TaxID=3379826 RepID=UPI003EE393DB